MSGWRINGRQMTIPIEFRGETVELELFIYNQELTKLWLLDRDTHYSYALCLDGTQKVYKYGVYKRDYLQRDEIDIISSLMQMAIAVPHNPFPEWAQRLWEQAVSLVR